MYYIIRGPKKGILIPSFIINNMSISEALDELNQMAKCFGFRQFSEKDSRGDVGFCRGTEIVVLNITESVIEPSPEDIGRKD